MLACRSLHGVVVFVRGCIWNYISRAGRTQQRSCFPISCRFAPVSFPCIYPQPPDVRVFSCLASAAAVVSPSLPLRQGPPPPWHPSPSLCGVALPPSQVTSPDYEKASCLNAVLVKMWPHLSLCITQRIQTSVDAFLVAQQPSSVRACQQPPHTALCRERVEQPPHRT